MHRSNTARSVECHPGARAKPIVIGRSALTRAFSARIAQIREEQGWSYEHLARVLDLAKTYAYRLCNAGKASAEQLDRVLAHARRAT